MEPEVVVIDMKYRFGNRCGFGLCKKIFVRSAALFFYLRAAPGIGPKVLLRAVKLQHLTEKLIIRCRKIAF